ncbi:hypothetical protein AVDCRST_MAG81-2929 [uncultured Synechococcales cyanobacterium]|uniref:Uncharacterized protein n=1 Tax=uncultured Synechococcales cyanobacterium TaxID=1936017 RepID=A0A6J4V9A0_9CYAN|nr:hypothetical protein AVDCRST_MAG81-2929 [uncultured Synechococcales cyanobacterium]
MAKGLLWLPLLALFIGLAWSGWNEYRKVEAYQLWAAQFEKAKYDIYAVLGQANNNLTWGKPTRNGPIELKTFSLKQVRSITLQVDGQSVDLTVLPSRGKVVAIEFQLYGSNPIQVPFTEVALAASWAKHLQQYLETLQYEKIE